ncbi:fibroblast growth factor receptor substrate 2 [Lingula anatina]|uniref:Fibroblast growth factor receptor substrate 2 n=1 Tax=Lingula anatina TaxID=7574 RepID=A0A1S3K371_LINAN|nr:fibroblast growth factor receptor substrate 2 [Lingula anatina]XP_013416709.1 fibroblast growth factor receptor substrate 2 [Lingula anatina]XP_013416711.1 fibroblast growth factor receptor substrate 2 [Lingula anatina]XP_013416712.1 fibroblast growth factor receptor substrate 2 [Lingula anatina]|eukprot:XP_013416708.1 fibroblast growth factor receptor substrate 2 [Lingula anatina]
MGCAIAKQDQECSNIFHVYNVDEQGNSANAGRLEIANMDLVLHQRGKEPIRWPVRCLRRYGYDQDIFSFESGRRCPTGPGIYAFRCRQAETLFNMLQEVIQTAGQENDTHTNQNGSISLSRPVSYTEQQSPHLLLPAIPSQNGTSMARRDHLYVNGTIASEYLPPSQVPQNGTVLLDATHDYVNTANAARALRTHNGTNSLEHTKIQITFDNNDNPSAIINYAVLDLPKSTENLTEGANITSRSCVQYTNLVDPPPIERGSPISSRKPSSGSCMSGNSVAEMDTTTSSTENLSSPTGQPNGWGAALGNGGPGVGVHNGGTQPTYINVGAEAKKMEFPNAQDPKVPPKPSSEQHSYANLDLVPQNCRREPLGMRRVNYIQLDLEKTPDDRVNGADKVPPSPLSLLSVPDSPSRKTESYATIDFNKTAALSKTAGPSPGQDEGQRKTRHNSTIADLE